jgi:hypothetical protein
MFATRTEQSKIALKSGNRSMLAQKLTLTVKNRRPFYGMSQFAAQAQACTIKPRNAIHREF